MVGFILSKFCVTLAVVIINEGVANTGSSDDDFIENEGNVGADVDADVAAGVVTDVAAGISDIVANDVCLAGLSVVIDAVSVVNFVDCVFFRRGVDDC